MSKILLTGIHHYVGVSLDDLPLRQDSLNAPHGAEQAALCRVERPTVTIASVRLLSWCSFNARASYVLHDAEISRLEKAGT